MDSHLKRIKDLVRLVKYYDYELHIKGNTLISDESYDAMRRELEFLEEKHPQFIQKDSPSLYIGQISSSVNKIISREKPLLSLRHTYDKKELYKNLMEFLEKDNSIVLEPKLDGVSLCLKYVDGIIDSLSLRGDGIKGEDVTHFAPYINNIPLKIKDFSGEIRGELIVSKHKVKENNRNYVSGCIRKKEAYDFDGKFFPYEVVGLSLSTQEENLLWLKQYFEITDYKILKNLDDLMEIVEKFRTQDFEYFVDGVVFKINNINIFQDLGITLRYPRGAIAFKTSENSAITTVKSIDWSMNRQGFLIPVIEIDPIDIEGNKIHKVHGHNKGYLEKYGLEKGAKVSVARIGNVIPQISSVLESKAHKEIKKCCFCENEVLNSTMHYKCNNNNCEEKILNQVSYFFQKIELKEMSKKKLEQFQTPDFQNYFEFLNIVVENLNKKHWVKDKNELNISNNWFKIKLNINILNYFIALGIPGIADSFFKKLPVLNDPIDYVELFQNKPLLKKHQTFFDFLTKNLSLIQSVYYKIKSV